MVDGGKDLGDGAADHQLDERWRDALLHLARPDRLTVAEHGVAIGELLHLLQEVADVDDGDAALAQPADHVEELVYVTPREGARRLVHHHHARVVHERARDLHHLSARGAEALDLGAHGDVVVSEERERLLDLRAGRLAPHHTEAGDLPAQHDVVLDAQIGREVELLVDHRDTLAPRVEGAGR